MNCRNVIQDQREKLDMFFEGVGLDVERLQAGEGEGGDGGGERGGGQDDLFFIISPTVNCLALTLAVRQRADIFTASAVSED